MREGKKQRRQQQQEDEEKQREDAKETKQETKAEAKEGADQAVAESKVPQPQQQQSAHAHAPFPPPFSPRAGASMHAHESATHGAAPLAERCGVGCARDGRVATRGPCCRSACLPMKKTLFFLTIGS